MAQSYKQQLANAQARLAAIQAKIEELTPLAAAEPETTVDLSLLVNTTVFARIGRCTSTGQVPEIVQATVLAVKEGEGKVPAQARITYGEGFDTTTAVVNVAALASTKEAADAELAKIVAAYNKAKEAADAAAKAAADAAEGVEPAAPANADPAPASDDVLNDIG